MIGLTVISFTNFMRNHHESIVPFHFQVEDDALRSLHCAVLSNLTKLPSSVEPNMATMLSYILTDLAVPKSTLEACLKKVVKGSFNTISVDGDQSTSDTVLVMSSQIVDYKDSDLVEFEKAMLEVCTGLAEDIVRNGNRTFPLLFRYALFPKSCS